jgi:succinoglycan biosynthesis protein ExoA
MRKTNLQIDVSVITPVRNEAAVLDGTASTILEQRFDGTIEFLFVEGRSHDGTRAILERLSRQDPRIQILDNPRGDLGSALQIGLAGASGEFIAKMDAHTWFPPDYLQHAVARLRRGDVNWVSGPPLPVGVDRWSRRVALALGTRLGVGGSRKWGSEAASGPERDLDTGVFSGVWTRSSLERLGGWDPAWPVNEDSELAARYLAAGERLVCLPEMGARYLPRNTLLGLAHQYFRYGQYRAKTANRHPNSVRRSTFLPSALVLALGLPVLGRTGRWLSAGVVLAYVSALATISTSRAGEADVRDAAALPAVFATMHLTYGLGFLSGCAKFGFPGAAIRRVIAS